MRFFYVRDDYKEGVYRGTLALAHDESKGLDNFSVTIEEVEVPTEKENILRLLNAEGGHESARGRKWGLTPRGALREITGEE